ncbi:NADH dehydrogenase [ubiquinone] 1 beta subcomplex subunit 7 isoform X1 [Tiliqua scincoides]|uniref:NADH dehydrogenase [ubiquinone] 1 beta subcomplex subunit 7 isoform X1 n=1 Tax=Tiliqua scincoides TaxID=71010 RepID=UPI003462DB5B
MMRSLSSGLVFNVCRSVPARNGISLKRMLLFGQPGAGLKSVGVMIATQQQMNDAQLPLEQRDYCAHYLIKLMKCKRDKFPNIFGCKHERHDWDYCEHLDYVMRMKEFERERRLLARKKRIEQKERAAAAASSS